MAPTLLMLHGFTHTGASWDPVAAGLGGRYRVLAPDIRGHGAASDAEPLTLAAVIEDIDTLADGPFMLVGYSMGGRIALHAALTLGPERVRRLVLVGASPGIADPGERAARRAADERLASELEGLTIESFAERWAGETAVLAGQPPEVRVAAHADRLRNTPTGLARALRGLGTGALPSLWERLGKIKVPVTLIVGERDSKFRGIGGEMAALLGGPVEVIVVPGTGHSAHLEAPGVVAELIRAA
jgi:2-succinyl-6-hydroxy-2,4-cyclohexadiene-1-carboxylate synthase